jgi:beta-lactamase regulating signal transducer with metallopeptidase domain
MQAFLEMGLSNALLATLLALVATAVGRLSRRPALVHFLWLLVLLKLITPPFLKVPVTWPESLAASPGEPTSTTAEPPAPTFTKADPVENEDQVAPDEALAFAANEEEPDDLLQSEPPEVLTAGAPTQSQWNWEFWTQTVGLIWLGGATCWLALALRRLYRFHCLLHFGRPAPQPLQVQAEGLSRRLGLAWCPELWLVPGRISPLLWAVGGQVRLVLPAALLECLTAEQQATLLAHELAHARRHDHWVRWLELVAISLYWWHPVAWWARRQLQQAEEQCCDAWVVWLLPAAARAYARTLLQTVDFLDARPALPPLASGIGHVHLLKRRLAMIVRQPFSPRLPWPLQVGALVVGLLVLGVAPHYLEAKAATESAIIFGADEDEAAPPAARNRDSKTDDLERRLDALEAKMDRVLRALTGQKAKASDEKKARDGAQDTERRAQDAERRAKEAAERAVQRAKEIEKRIYERNLDAAKRAAERGAEAEKRAKEKAKSEFAKQKDKKRVELDIQFMDPKQLKDLEKQIEDMVNQALNPERMKQMEKKIEDLVNKNVNPERMEKLGKEIEEIVKRSINPQRMEQLSRQIEAAVNRSLKAEKQERDAKQAKENSPRPPRKTPTAGRDDLERRIDQLEQKMDRLLKALEDSRRRQE